MTQTRIIAKVACLVRVETQPENVYPAIGRVKNQASAIETLAYIRTFSNSQESFVPKINLLSTQSQRNICLIGRQDSSRIAEIKKSLIKVEPFSIGRTRSRLSSRFLRRLELYEHSKERPEMPIAVWHQALQ